MNAGLSAHVLCGVQRRLKVTRMKEVLEIKDGEVPTIALTTHRAARQHPDT